MYQGVCDFIGESHRAAQSAEMHALAKHHWTGGDFVQTTFSIQFVLDSSSSLESRALSSTMESLLNTNRHGYSTPFNLASNGCPSLVQRFATDCVNTYRVNALRIRSYSILACLFHFIHAPSFAESSQSHAGSLIVVCHCFLYCFKSSDWFGLEHYGRDLSEGAVLA